jgi:ribosomal-protein-alanine N-acetyltransferase
MIDYSRLPYRVEPMTSYDLDAVMEIEYASFSAPWSARAYDYELHYNEMAHYYVARPQNGAARPAVVAPRRSWWQRMLGRARAANSVPAAPAPLVGYGGFWMMVDEAHVSTIATHPEWRRRGIGELLLLAMLEGAAEVGARVVTLEVRVSNESARALYRKYGFEVAGARKNYYSDNGEDALIMTTPTLTLAEYQRTLQGLKDTLYARLSQ